MSVSTYTKTGTKSTIAVKLDKEIFGQEVKNHNLLKQAYDAYLANGRVNLARTKTRGQVRGSTIKPWRQKGTGRARFGSRYNPIWRGGGITFGPTGEENYTKKMPVKAKRTAIKQALSLAAQEDRIKIIEAIESKEGKVKPTAELLKKIDAKGNVLLVVETKGELLVRATQNLPNLKVTPANYLSTYDLINADCIVISQKALEVMNVWLGDAK